MWMVGEIPAYFVQYQVDSYAIMRGYEKVILVWKPKYIEYPSVVKLEDFQKKNKKLIGIRFYCIIFNWSKVFFMSVVVMR